MMKCVKKIPVIDNECLSSCEGLYITSYEKKEFEDDYVGKILSLVTEDYEKYKAKGLPKYPASMSKGKSQKPCRYLLKVDFF